MRLTNKKLLLTGSNTKSPAELPKNFTSQEKSDIDNGAPVWGSIVYNLELLELLELLAPYSVPLGENSRAAILTSERKLPITEDEPEPGSILYNCLGNESLLMPNSLLSLEKAMSANVDLLPASTKLPICTNLPNGSTVPASCPFLVTTKDEAVPNELVLMV